MGVSQAIDIMLTRYLIFVMLLVGCSGTETTAPNPYEITLDTTSTLSKTGVSIGYIDGYLRSVDDEPAGLGSYVSMHQNTLYLGFDRFGIGSSRGDMGWRFYLDGESFLYIEPERLSELDGSPETLKHLGLRVQAGTLGQDQVACATFQGTLRCYVWFTGRGWVQSNVVNGTGVAGYKLYPGLSMSSFCAPGEGSDCGSTSQTSIVAISAIFTEDLDSNGTSAPMSPASGSRLLVVYKLEVHMQNVTLDSQPLLPVPVLTRTWTSDPKTEASFGDAVAVGGDDVQFNIFVSAPEQSSGSNAGTGVVYAYALTDVTNASSPWAIVGKLKGSDSLMHGLGACLDFSFPVLVIGAPGGFESQESLTRSGRSSVHAIDINAARMMTSPSAMPAGTILFGVSSDASSSAVNYAELGAAIAVDIDDRGYVLALVGAPGANTVWVLQSRVTFGYADRGVPGGFAMRTAGVYDFERSNAPSLYSSSDRFGHSVGLAMGYVMIGLPGYNSGQGLIAGSAWCTVDDFLGVQGQVGHDARPHCHGCNYGTTSVGGRQNSCTSCFAPENTVWNGDSQCSWECSVGFVNYTLLPSTSLTAHSSTTKAPAATTAAMTGTSPKTTTPSVLQTTTTVPTTVEETSTSAPSTTTMPACVSCETVVDLPQRAHWNTTAGVDCSWSCDAGFSGDACEIAECPQLMIHTQLPRHAIWPNFTYVNQSLREPLDTLCPWECHADRVKNVVSGYCCPATAPENATLGTGPAAQCFINCTWSGQAWDSALELCVNETLITTTPTTTVATTPAPTTLPPPTTPYASTAPTTPTTWIPPFGQDTLPLPTTVAASELPSTPESMPTTQPLGFTTVPPTTVVAPVTGAPSVANRYVLMEIRLNLSYIQTTATTESTTVFSDALVSDITAALQQTDARMTVTSLVAGSIVATLQLFSPSYALTDADAILTLDAWVQSLRAQAATPGSILRSGTVTASVLHIENKGYGLIPDVNDDEGRGAYPKPLMSSTTTDDRFSRRLDMPDLLTLVSALVVCVFIVIVIGVAWVRYGRNRREADTDQVQQGAGDVEMEGLAPGTAAAGAAGGGGGMGAGGRTSLRHGDATRDISSRSFAMLFGDSHSPHSPLRPVGGVRGLFAVQGGGYIGDLPSLTTTSPSAPRYIIASGGGGAVRRDASFDLPAVDILHDRDSSIVQAIPDDLPQLEDDT